MKDKPKCPQADFDAWLTQATVDIQPTPTGAMEALDYIKQCAMDAHATNDPMKCATVDMLIEHTGLQVASIQRRVRWLRGEGLIKTVKLFSAGTRRYFVYVPTGKD